MLDSSPITSEFFDSSDSRMGSRTHLYVELKLEVDQAKFSINADNDLIVVTPDHLSDLKALCTGVFTPLLQSEARIAVVESALERMGMTVCIYHRFASILGPEANPLLRGVIVRLFSSRR